MLSRRPASRRTSRAKDLAAWPAACCRTWLGSQGCEDLRVKHMRLWTNQSLLNIHVLAQVPAIQLGACLAQYTESRPTKSCHAARSAKRRPAVGDSRHCRRTSRDCDRHPQANGANLHSTRLLATLCLVKRYSFFRWPSRKLFCLTRLPNDVVNQMRDGTLWRLSFTPACRTNTSKKAIGLNECRESSRNEPAAMATKKLGIFLRTLPQIASPAATHTKQKEL